jgi:hypothetical protein
MASLLSSKKPTYTNYPKKKRLEKEMNRPSSLSFQEKKNRTWLSMSESKVIDQNTTLVTFLYSLRLSLKQNIIQSTQFFNVGVRI